MDELVKKEARFCQADELIKALHIMNNTELKFMFFSLSQRNIGDTEITTTMADLISQLKLDWGGEQVKTYQKAIKSIIQKSVISVEMGWDRLSETDRSRLKNPTDTVLVSGALMSAKLFPDMTIELSFNKDFIPMLDDLKHDFTWIYLEQMARLNGKYSPRIYEWLKMQLKDKNECHFIWYLNTDSKEAPGLRQWLNLGDKYKEYKALRRRVLDPSFDEINECTSDIKVTFKPLRNGARTPIYALDMTIEAKHKSNKIALKKNKKKKEKESYSPTPVTSEQLNEAYRAQLFQFDELFQSLSANENLISKIKDYLVFQKKENKLEFSKSRINAFIDQLKAYASTNYTGRTEFNDYAAITMLNKALLSGQKNIYPLSSNEWKVINEQHPFEEEQPLWSHINPNVRVLTPEEAAIREKEIDELYEKVTKELDEEYAKRKEEQKRGF